MPPNRGAQAKISCNRRTQKGDSNGLSKKNVQQKTTGGITKICLKRQTSSGTYEVYRGNNAESARTFLASQKVDQKKYYIKVETPEGNWGIDIVWDSISNNLFPFS